MDAVFSYCIVYWRRCPLPAVSVYVTARCPSVRLSRRSIASNQQRRAAGLQQSGRQRAGGQRHVEIRGTRINTDLWSITLWSCYCSRSAVCMSSHDICQTTCTTKLSGVAVDFDPIYINFVGHRPKFNVTRENVTLLLKFKKWKKGN